MLGRTKSAQFSLKRGSLSWTPQVAALGGQACHSPQEGSLNFQRDELDRSPQEKMQLLEQKHVKTI